MHADRHANLCRVSGLSIASDGHKDRCRPENLQHRHLAMGTLPVWIKRTQTAGLIVTGAAIGYYYVSPALRVEEVSLPANTLLAKARMFGIDGKKVLVLF